MNPALSSPSQGSMPRAVLERAADWLALLSSGDATAADHDACSRWRAAAPEHDAAYQQLRQVWGHFEPLAAADAQPSRAALSAELARASRRGKRRRFQGAAAMAGMLVAAALLASQYLSTWSAGYLLADHRAAIGQLREVALPDGSRILLNTGSAADVNFSTAERRIVLRQGELLAQVAPDPQGRPFVVQTPWGRAQALGTRYTVRLHGNVAEVVVLESRVRVCGQVDQDCRDMAPGQRLRLDAQGLGEPQAVDATVASAWSRHRLAADDTPLPQVLAELNRYRPGLLHYDGAALADLSVSGVFPLDDPDRALDMLAAHLPVRIERPLPLLTRVVRATD